MSGIKKVLMSSLITVMILTTACSGSNNSASSKTSNSSSQTNTSSQANTSSQTNSDSTTTSEVSLTLEELKQYDGQNGNPAYVAVDGVIYDVSNVRKWKDGKHEMGVTAGQDLSELINQSPHGKAILSEAPVVGKIK